MSWVCTLLFFALAGALIWILILHQRLDERQGWIDRTQKEIDFVKHHCPDEWARISATIMRKQ